MNYQVIAISTVLATIFFFLTKYSIKHLIEFLQTVKRIQQQKKFSFAKRGPRPAQLRLKEDSLKHEYIYSLPENRILFIFNKYLKIFMHLSLISIFLFVTIAMFWWMKHEGF